MGLSGLHVVTARLLRCWRERIYPSHGNQHVSTVKFERWHLKFYLSKGIRIIRPNLFNLNYFAYVYKKVTDLGQLKVKGFIYVDIKFDSCTRQNVFLFKLQH